MSKGVPCPECGQNCFWSIGEDQYSTYCRWDCQSCGSKLVRKLMNSKIDPEDEADLEVWTADGDLKEYFPSNPAAFAYTELLLPQMAETAKATMRTAAYAIKQSGVLTAEYDDDEELSDDDSPEVQ